MDRLFSQSRFGAAYGRTKMKQFDISQHRTVLTAPRLDAFPDLQMSSFDR
jgi:hypothetical protein